MEKKHGKGYYNYGLVRFEGEYLNDKKWNGKGYDINGNIIYELNNGNGKIKEFDYNNKLIFEGEFLNGEKNGKGKEYLSGELFFELYSFIYPLPFFIS